MPCGLFWLVTSPVDLSLRLSQGLPKAPGAFGPLCGRKSKAFKNDTRPTSHRHTSRWLTVNHGGSRWLTVNHRIVCGSGNTSGNTSGFCRVFCRTFCRVFCPTVRQKAAAPFFLLLFVALLLHFCFRGNSPQVAATRGNSRQVAAIRGQRGHAARPPFYAVLFEPLRKRHAAFLPLLFRFCSRLILFCFRFVPVSSWFVPAAAAAAGWADPNFPPSPAMKRGRAQGME